MDRTCIYLNDFSDECIPCVPTADGWAGWLSAPDPDWGRDESAKHGEVFPATEITYRYVSYRCRDGEIVWYNPPPVKWSFAAPAFGHGMGWNPDDLAHDMTALRAVILVEDDGTDGVAAFALSERECAWRYSTWPKPTIHEVAPSPATGGRE